jgi:hypothetical protein
MTFVTNGAKCGQLALPVRDFGPDAEIASFFDSTSDRRMIFFLDITGSSL